MNNELTREDLNLFGSSSSLTITQIHQNTRTEIRPLETITKEPRVGIGEAYYHESPQIASEPLVLNVPSDVLATVVMPPNLSHPGNVHADIGVMVVILVVAAMWKFFTRKKTLAKIDKRPRFVPEVREVQPPTKDLPAIEPEGRTPTKIGDLPVGSIDVVILSGSKRRLRSFSELSNSPCRGPFCHGRTQAVDSNSESQQAIPTVNQSIAKRMSVADYLMQTQ